MNAVQTRKDRVVTGLTKGVEFLFKKNKIDWIKGTARLTGNGGVDVFEGEKQTLRARKEIIVATGSTPRGVPGIEIDRKRIITSDEAIGLREVPKVLVIMGSGAVGVEFASCFHRFGTKVSLFEMLPRIVPVEDEEVSRELERYFKKTGMRVETGARAENVEKTDNGVRFSVTLAGGKQETIEAETLLVAIGRKPLTENIGLEGTRVQLDRGFIKVDEYQRTGEPGVYAIGDVVAGTPQLAHVATAEGMVAIAHMAGKPAIPVDKTRIPSCTYTEPGIGSVGLTEAQARAQGRRVKVGKFPFAANSKASILGQHTGFVKIVADEAYGEVLGIHIIGPEAFELISEGVLAMTAEATIDTLIHTVHAHPTLYEAMGEAFNAVYGQAINA
jgi:dihydrolipoamide dehydrogenase